MEIKTKKDYELVWRIYDLLKLLDAPWEEVSECLDAISEYNKNRTKYKSGHAYGELK